MNRRMKLPSIKNEEVQINYFLVNTSKELLSLTVTFIDTTNRVIIDLCQKLAKIDIIVSHTSGSCLLAMLTSMCGHGFNPHTLLTCFNYEITTNNINQFYIYKTYEVWP